MTERKYFSISVKHTAFRRWKFGKPCVLWGHNSTEDDERCFFGYTEYPNQAKLYSLEEWKNQECSEWIKTEPVKMCVDFCEKYKNYDTVLVDAETYLAYCLGANLPLNNPYCI